MSSSKNMSFQLFISDFCPGVKGVIVILMKFINRAMESVGYITVLVSVAKEWYFFLLFRSYQAARLIVLCALTRR